jgi:hypothetical protein
MVPVAISEVETLRLRLSGLIFQRRSDGRWRDLDQVQDADEEAGRFTPGPDDWHPAGLAIDVGGRAEWGPGSHDDEEAWWLLYGDNRRGPVEVRLADGRTPPIIRFGPLWICEWTSRTQPAVVSLNGDSFMFFHRVPAYLLDLNDGGDH